MMPAVRRFTPAGLSPSCLDEVVLKVEEVEALRLKDYMGLEQEECAERMRVSRPTFQRILGEAHAKVADALVNGKTLRIEGGHYCLGRGYCRRLGRLLASEEECRYLDNLGGVNVEEKSKSSARRIAVSAAGNEISSLVDGRFGRCSYFVIMSLDGEDFEVIPNQNQDAGHGAGTGAAQTVINAGVEAVITSRIGPKAFALLERSGIPVFKASEDETVASNRDRYCRGELQRLEHANN